MTSFLKDLSTVFHISTDHLTETEDESMEEEDEDIDVDDDEKNADSSDNNRSSSTPFSTKTGNDVTDRHRSVNSFLKFSIQATLNKQNLFKNTFKFCK